MSPEIIRTVFKLPSAKQVQQGGGEFTLFREVRLQLGFGDIWLARFRVKQLAAGLRSNLREKRADVFADARLDLDFKAGFARHLKRLAGCIAARNCLPVVSYGALASNNFHCFGFVGIEVIFTRINQPQGLLGAILQEQTVADDFPLKIDVGFGNGCYSTDFFRYR